MLVSGSNRGRERVTNTQAGKTKKINKIEKFCYRNVFDGLTATA